ncbi:MAG: nucleotide-binding protein [Actinomycetota bacterium]|nr:nucleotide-binding protein [Actinomycetota bacterium]
MTSEAHALKPTIFLGSSTEAVTIVNRLVGLMSPRYTMRPWNQVFTPGEYTLDSLLREVEQADGAVFIFAKDDELGFRGEATFSARDNVILEYGLFVSRLGRDRVLIVEEQGVKMPADVFGITTHRFPADEAARNAALAEFAEQVAGRWSSISTRPTDDIEDAGLGYARTLRTERNKIEDIAGTLWAFHREKAATATGPFELGSTAAPISTYSEALDRVRRRFWTTTFLSSGFWTRPVGRVISANERMLERVKATQGEARRLFLLDQPPDMVVQAYRDHRVLQRQLHKYDELERLADDHRRLKGNMEHLLAQGFEVKVVFDEDKLYERLLPDEIVWDPKDSELAIYDEFRLDIFDGGSRGVIHGVRSYSSVTPLFPVYLDAATKYFDELWRRALPMTEFIEALQEAVDSAIAKIDYASNWLAIYEYALSDEDEKLKTVELARVEEIMRDAIERGFSAQRYLDIGTCTGRYPIQLRGCVAQEGYILGVDEDFDCVRFAEANVRRRCPDETRIEIAQADFTARQIGIGSPYDFVTCMLGTLSHFGWDRKPSREGDRLQRALNRMGAFLRPEGLLFLGTWSEYACNSLNMLGIYRQTDRERLAAWTAGLSELDDRLRRAGLEVIDRARPELRLDLTLCRRALH